MTTTLITLVSLHVFLLLTAAIIFYSLLLQLLSKRGTTKKILLHRSVTGFVIVVISWLVSVLYLSRYYIGNEGFVTSAKDISSDISTLVPTFVYIREILLPLLFVVSLILLLCIFWKGGQLEEKPKYNKIFIPLATLSCISAAVLVFLGILIP